MCIISGPVESVKQTKLFVLPSKDGRRQMTFYTNEVRTKEENLMILPVPNPDTVKLHTVKYKRMFDDLQNSVRYIHPVFENTRSYYPLALSASASVLDVIDHGSYRVSIAPTVHDLLRLNTTVFHVPPDLYQFFCSEYNSEFGYICCVLKPGIHRYEPLCYSHVIHSSKKLFVPTLHYHNHGGTVSTKEADWDHKIYSIGTTEQANLQYRSLPENTVKWSKFPEEFQRTATEPVRCAFIQGHQKNCDIVLTVL